MAHRKRLVDISTEEILLNGDKFVQITYRQLWDFGKHCALEALKEYQKGQEEWMSIDALLERINYAISAQSIRNMCRKGQVKARRDGSKWMIDATDYLRRNGNKTTN